MANKRFGDTLRELRNAKGYTQQQVAELLGLKNRSTLGSWEVGKSEPDGYTLLKLCKIYEVEDIYTAFGEVSPNPYPSEDADEILAIYNLLNRESRELIDKLIVHLYGMQKEKSNHSTKAAVELAGKPGYKVTEV